jgi:phosphohistidine phosphatase SixA
MRCVSVLALAVLPGLAVAQDLSPLSSPGAVGLLRHAIAPGTGDPENFNLDDCATQRNLSEEGRAQARRIGEAVRAAGIDIDRVWTSQWCRARHTAELLDLAPVEELPALNSFFRERTSGPEQTEAVRDALAGLPDGERAILVTHQVNITALTDVFPASGEMVVVDVDNDGTFEVTGRIRFDD